MAKLNIYHYMLTDPSRFKRFSSQSQRSVYVATETLKRAAELFGVGPHDIRNYGGIGGPKALQELCRSEPDVVFVGLSHGEYLRLDDIDDDTKRITLDMTDEDTYGRRIDSPAFGQIDVHRISGSINLFGVDYPQDHFIRLSVHTAHLNRNAGTDRVLSDTQLISIDMSEVQWARLIASPNTSGVSCTLSRYFDPETGDFLTPKLPDRHVADAQTFKDEVKDRAKKAMVDVEAARARIAELLSGGPLRKGDLQEVLELLESGNRQFVANLPYIVERAGETIDEATENAKTEVGAFVDFAMLKLGERVLGDKVRDALAAGADLKAIGREVAEAVMTVPAITDQREDED
jgi:hypothetical protein